MCHHLSLFWQGPCWSCLVVSLPSSQARNRHNQANPLLHHQVNQVNRANRANPAKVRVRKVLNPGSNLKIRLSHLLHRNNGRRASLKVVNRQCRICRICRHCLVNRIISRENNNQEKISRAAKAPMASRINPVIQVPVVHHLQNRAACTRKVDSPAKAVVKWSPPLASQVKPRINSSRLIRQRPMKMPVVSHRKLIFRKKPAAVRATVHNSPVNHLPAASHLRLHQLAGARHHHLHRLNSLAEALVVASPLKERPVQELRAVECPLEAWNCRKESRHQLAAQVP